MAKVTIVGDAVVITSAKKLEDIKLLEKYRPKALCLFETTEDGSRETVFKVGSTGAHGCITKYGASFGSTTHDEEKLATITLDLPRDVADAKKFVADAIGAAILSLNKVEAQFDAALAEVNAEKAAVMENITVA